MVTRYTAFVALAFAALLSGCSDKVDALFSSAQLINPPESSDRKAITQLAYLDAYDEVLGDDYAFVAYKEEDKRSGEWRLKIKGKKVADTSIKPESPILRRKMAEAAQAGKDYVVTGFNIQPRNNDPRLVEHRVYFDEALQPQHVELHLVTRNRDASPKVKQVARFDWPAVQESKKKLLAAPASTASAEVEELAYIDAYDVIADTDYAYLAYKVSDKKSGEWMLKIMAKSTAGTSIDPASTSLAKKFQAAASEGRDYITTGFQLSPREGDPRMVEHRVYFDPSLTPTRVEMHVVTRKADGSPFEKKVARFPWPV